MADNFAPDQEVQTDPIDTLYKVVTDKGLYTKSLDEFKKKYSSPDEIGKLYQVVKDKGLYSKSPEEFNQRYFSSTAAASIPKLDYRAPVKTAAPKESANIQAPSIPKEIPTETTADQFTKRHAEAQNLLHKELTGNNDLIPDVIKKQKASAQADQNLTNFAEHPRSDQPLTATQQIANSLLPKPPEPTVNDQDVNDFIQNVQTEPTAGRAFLQHVIQAKPDKAPAVQSAMYLNDAMNRLSEDPNAGTKEGKVVQNAQKIAKGDLHYSVQGGLLTKPESAWQSISTGLQQKNKAFADYDTFSNASPEQAIQELEKRRGEHDPDEPIPVPEGFMGELAGGMAGQPLKGLVAGKIAGTATALIPGAQEAAPAVDKFITAAVSSNDFRKMSYAHALQQNYNQLRNEGMTPEHAYEKANGQAKDEAMVDAISGAAMMYGAGAIGDLKLPGFNLSSGFKNAVINGLKQGAKGIGEAGAIGLIQGAGQDVKNKLAEDKGIQRSGSGEDIKNAMESGALFTLGMAALAKGGSLMSAKTRTQLLQSISKATPEQINAEIGNQLIDKHITPEEAVSVKKEIEDHRVLDAGIPENVTEESRLKIQDKIRRRDYLEMQLESADAAFHPEIKEKIKAVNEDILELAKDKTPKGSTDGNIVPRGTIEDKPEAKIGEPEINPAGVEGAGSSIASGQLVSSNHFEGERKVVHVSDDGQHVIVEDPGGDHIRHEIPINEIKTTENASSIRKNQSGTGEEGAIGEGSQNSRGEDLQLPPEQASGYGETSEQAGKVEEPPMTGITHAQTDETAKQLGLDTYEQKPETVKEWDAEADKRLKEDPQTIPKLLKKLEEGHEPDKIDQRIMVRHLSSLKARIDENPSNELLAQYKHAKDLSDIMGGREVAKSLVARRGSVPVKDSLADYLVEEMGASGVEDLTDAQKEKAKQEYDDISSAQKSYEDKIKDLETENAKLKAEAEIKSVKKSTKRVKEKTHDQHVQDRKDILAKARADLLKIAKGEGGLTASVPGVAQLVALAPHVKDMLKSLASEGFDKLEDVINELHNQFKDVIPDLSKKNIHDILAGEYNPERKSKSELSARVKDLTDEAHLINKLDTLLKGEEHKNEKQKIERKQQIKDLKDKISDFRKEESDAGKFYGESNVHELKIEKLKDELDRVANRREKEKVVKNSKVDNEISGREKNIRDQIKSEQDQWDAEEDFEKQVSTQYRKMETERNRQLEKVSNLKEKLDNLQNGIRSEGEKKTPKKDTSEIEDLKGQIKEATRILNETEATQKRMSKLQDELQRLKDRKEKDPSDYTKKQISNAEQSLKDQIKTERDSFNKEKREANKFYKEESNPTRSALNAIKSRNLTEAAKVKDALSKGNYAPEAKKTPLLQDPEVKKNFPNLVKDVQASRDAMIKVKQEREVRLLKQQYAQRSKVKKTMDVIAEIGNTPRALMSSLDFSAPLRQGLWGVTKQLTSHPGDLARQFSFMFKAAKSQKIFDRWFADLKEAPDYEVIQKSGLPLADPHDPKLAAKEEAFMSNYAEKIPIIGKAIKGSENAYVGFLNKMRVDMFRRAADGFASNGKTFANSPELYKAMADYIGAATGRGKMPEILEKSAPILNAAFFSPRLIASRMNLLTNWANPNFYSKVPKEIRVQYFKDMAKFIGTGALVLGLAKMGGADVETDPTSSDFGKIKIGNTRWDIWGGFQQYIRLAAQLIRGQQKSATTENITELNDPNNLRSKTRADVLMTFARGKLAPLPAESWDLLAGKDVTGQPATLGSEATKNLPLVLQDIYDAYQDKGVQGALGVGVPSMFGVGVQTFDSKTMSGGSGGGSGAGGTYKIKQWQ